MWGYLCLNLTALWVEKELSGVWSYGSPWNGVEMNYICLFVSFYKGPRWHFQLDIHTAFSWKASLDEMLYYIFLVCVYACTHTQHSGRDQETTWRSWFSPSHVSPRNCAQVMRFGDKFSDLLSHLAGPNVLFKFPTISYWLPRVQPVYSGRESTWLSVFPLFTAKWAVEPDLLHLLPVILVEEEKLAPSWAGGCLVFFLSAFGTAQWFSPSSFPAVKFIWRGILAAIRDREMWISTRTWKQLEWRRRGMKTIFQDLISALRWGWSLVYHIAGLDTLEQNIFNFSA